MLRIEGYTIHERYKIYSTPLLPIVATPINSAVCFCSCAQQNDELVKIVKVFNAHPIDNACKCACCVYAGYVLSRALRDGLILAAATDKHSC